MSLRKRAPLRSPTPDAGPASQGPDTTNRAPRMSDAETEMIRAWIRNQSQGEHTPAAQPAAPEFVPEPGVNYFNPADYDKKPDAAEPFPESLRAPMLRSTSTIHCHQPPKQESYLENFDLSRDMFGNERAPQGPLPRLVIPDGVGECAETASMTDGALRNLEVTEGYYKASQAMDKALFPNPAEQNKTANWTTFAVWASNEAGRAIRGEGNWVMGIGNALAPKSWMDATSDALAAGNQEVFAEIAPAFMMFAENFTGDTQRDEEKWKSFEKWMEKEAPNQDKKLGNRGLIDAFGDYYDAMVETDPDKKQELILMANAKIGVHEQTRLQKHILDAMPWGSRGALTATAMFLHTPKKEGCAPGFDFENNYDCLDLSKPVRDQHWYGPYSEDYPEHLQKLDSWQARETMEDVGPQWGSNWSVGAEKWSNFTDRMTYIAEMFRSKQSDPRLHNAPFTPEQKQSMQEKIKGE